MDKRRHYQSLRKLGEVQQLRLASERMRLVEVQNIAHMAAEEVKNCAHRRDASDRALDELLLAAEFCPDRFRMACGMLMIDEAEATESAVALEHAQTEEGEQRVIWHRSRLQLEWLDTQSASLGRKLSRKKEDKHIAENAAVRLLATAERGS